MNHDLLSVMTVAFVFATCSQVEAALITVDFDDVAVASGSNSIGGDIVSRGFFFDSPTNHTHRVNDAYGLSNGTTWMGNDNYFPVGAFNDITMIQVGGGAFNLIALDLAQWENAFASAKTVMLVGHYSGGGSINQTVDITGNFGSFINTVFGPGWTNLTSVVFTPSGGGNTNGQTVGVSLNWWAVDNIQVNTSPVPEPTSMALFSLGAVGLLGVRRRRQRTVDQVA